MHTEAGPAGHDAVGPSAQVPARVGEGSGTDARPADDCWARASPTSPATPDPLRSGVSGCLAGFDCHGRLRRGPRAVYAAARRTRRPRTTWLAPGIDEAPAATGPG
jgi:hypothetical protein